MKETDRVKQLVEDCFIKLNTEKERKGEEPPGKTFFPAS